MAQMPIEVCVLGQLPESTVKQSIKLANTIQSEFYYSLISESDAGNFAMLNFKSIQVAPFLDTMENTRKVMRGFHPFLIALTSAPMTGDRYDNLFGFIRGSKGLAVVTTDGVERVILPQGKLTAYFLYYFARCTLNFILPTHKNHDDARECVYDRKTLKTDLLKSMNSRPFCDDCRQNLLIEASSLSSQQYAALVSIFAFSGQQLEESLVEQIRKPQVFIGSSIEGLPIANKIQSLLQHEFSCEVWN